VAHDDDRALEHYERAVALAPAESRLLYERDQLAQRLGESEEQRLHRLSERFDVVAERDDLVVEYAGLLVTVGRPEEAVALLESRSFQPWEGGEGRVLGAWDHARAALGTPLGDPPSNLGEGRPLYEPPVARRADGEIDYFATSLPDLLLFHRTEDDDGSAVHARKASHPLNAG
jgi:hypothetical protein